MAECAGIPDEAAFVRALSENFLKEPALSARKELYSSLGLPPPDESGWTDGATAIKWFGSERQKKPQTTSSDKILRAWGRTYSWGQNIGTREVPLLRLFFILVCDLCIGLDQAKVRRK